MSFGSECRRQCTERVEKKRQRNDARRDASEEACRTVSKRVLRRVLAAWAHAWAAATACPWENSSIVKRQLADQHTYSWALHPGYYMHTLPVEYLVESKGHVETLK